MSDARADAWSLLAATAKDYAADPKLNAALSTAAKTWAACNGYVLAVGGAPAASGPVFPPYGRSKGKPVAGASEGDLRFYESGCLRTLNDPEKARWHQKEEALLDAIRAELVRQGFAVADDGSDLDPDEPDLDQPF